MDLENLVLEGADFIAIYSIIAEDSSAKKGIITCSKSMIKKYTDVLVKLIGKEKLEKEVEDRGHPDYSDDMGFNYEDHSLWKGYSLDDWKKDQQTMFDDWKKAIDRKPKTTQRVFTTKKPEPAPKPQPQPKPEPKPEPKQNGYLIYENPTREQMLKFIVYWLETQPKAELQPYYEHYKKNAFRLNPKIKIIP